MKLRTLIFITIVVVIALSIAGIISIPSLFGQKDSGETVSEERSFGAEEFAKLKIDWAAGSVKIVAGEADKITIQETKKSGNTHTMVTEKSGDTMTVRYSEGINANVANLSSKDLTITVPKAWICQDLEINGAALNVNISGLNTIELDLNGAATKLHYTGTIRKLECDGAAAQLNLNCNNNPQRVNISGAACKLTMALPADSGFTVETEGVAVDFNSNCTCNYNDGVYTYGDGSCLVEITGVGCAVTVNQGK